MPGGLNPPGSQSVGGGGKGQKRGQKMLRLKGDKTYSGWKRDLEYSVC